MAAVGKFVFVNYTGEPDVEAKQSLPTVRQHVMHDFFRRQREADNGLPPEEVAAPEVSAAKTKNSRRRDTNTRQAASQPCPKRSSVKRPSRARKDPQLHRQSSASSTELVFLQEFPEAKSISSSRTPSLDDTADSSPIGFTDSISYTDSSSPLFSVTHSHPSPDVFEEASPQSTSLVQINSRASPVFFQSDESALLQAPNPFLHSPAVHRWDPFNTLPLNGLAVDQLATWHFHRPINRNNIWESKVLWLDKVDSHFRRGLWSIALTSTPLFHVLLCIAEMKRSVLTGDRNQISYFEHKIAAMRAVSQGVSRLSSLPQFTGMNGMSLPCLTETSTDTFVMLVAIQVNLALGDKEYDAAKTHMRCVTDLVTKAGGLQSFGYTQWRHTIWNDLKLASALLERPMLEYGLRLESTNATFPPEVNTEAHRLSLETVRMIPTSGTLTSELAYDLFNRLHQLCLSFDTTLSEEAHFLAVENAFYTIVYQLCNSIADSQSHNECSDTDMLILGAQLSTWTCMPSLVNMRALFNTVINTIQSKLVYRLWNGLKPDLILQWESTAKLDSLLWVLFQASSAAISVCSTGETWMPTYMLESFLTTTRQVTMRLQIHSLAHFEKTLRSFPYSENVFGDDCRMLWTQMGLDDAGVIDGMVSPGSMIIEQM
ncbi:unnamed protein product [Aureobasidium vineae]|uniref:Transcription factor domain-containing protein n=1 Tax=Aureobasidium vineae TaxID=2773715 RepID=A0A9N8K2I0_9PEZI|nr:unnamed protein product [Aureobasidium vineae]